jgi:hypothetical protein
VNCSSIRVGRHVEALHATDKTDQSDITVQYSYWGQGRNLSASPASHMLMRVPRGPSNATQSLRSGVRAIQVTTKPSVNTSCSTCRAPRHLANICG